MKFNATHSSLDLEELVMVTDGGKVYRQSEDFMEVEFVGWIWDFSKSCLLPINN